MSPNRTNIVGFPPKLLHFGDKRFMYVRELKAIPRRYNG